MDSITFCDIFAKDAKHASPFYKQVFDWKIEQFPSIGY